MDLNPYLSFNGTCEAAFKFYEEALGGKGIVIMKYRDSPMSSAVPPDWQDKVMHGHMFIGGQMIMGSDPSASHFSKPQGITLSLSTDKADEAERLFNALAVNAKVSMPLQETFWATRFGMLEDQFGIPWMVNCGKAA